MLTRHRERMAELQSGSRGGAGSSTGGGGGEIEARLARLEQSIDAIAVEVERTGEAQRFLTKVLTTRLPPPEGGAST